MVDFNDDLLVHDRTARNVDPNRNPILFAPIYQTSGSPGPIAHAASHWQGTVSSQRISRLAFQIEVRSRRLSAERRQSDKRGAKNLTFECLEGQSRDALGANGSLPVGRGVGDGTWTTAGLVNW